MQPIYQTKIGKVTPKKNINYPIIRLPPSCSDLIGKTANIYVIMHEGQRALLITFDGKVVQQVSIEERVAAIEKKLELLLKSFEREVQGSLQQRA
jgi:thiamine kinase-like enzyme